MCLFMSVTTLSFLYYICVILVEDNVDLRGVVTLLYHFSEKVLQVIIYSLLEQAGREAFMIGNFN